MIAWKYSQMIDHVHDFRHDSASFTLWCVWIIASHTFDKNLTKETDEHHGKKHDLEKERKYSASYSLFFLFVAHSIEHSLTAIFVPAPGHLEQISTAATYPQRYRPRKRVKWKCNLCACIDAALHLRYTCLVSVDFV